MCEQQGERCGMNDGILRDLRDTVSILEMKKEGCIINTMTDVYAIGNNRMFICLLRPHISSTHSTYFFTTTTTATITFHLRWGRYHWVLFNPHCFIVIFFFFVST